MKNLIPYEKDLIGEYDKVVARKEDPRRELLQRIRPQIKERFDAYEKAKKNLEQIQPLDKPFTKDEREALLHCYDVQVSDLTSLLGLIKSQQPEECQYCCGMTLANTWDHYLPKSPHPEFAIYAPNLVWSCFTCNNDRPRWLVNGTRTCIHFYYDTFDASVPLIEATIEFNDHKKPMATFDLTYDPAQTTDAFKRLFATHFEKLGLKDKLHVRAAELLDDIRTEVNDWIDDPISEDNVCRHLEKRSRSRAQSVGANHIKTILYRAASKSLELVRYYLRNRQPSVPGATP